MFQRNKKLKYHEDKGYYYIHPPFSEEELNAYYRDRYWKEYRSDHQISINKRDILHYNLIISKTGGFFDEKQRTIVNFGSGHGGISFLFYLNGHQVINIEPDTIIVNDLNLEKERWVTKNAINELVEDYDFFYSSHSLEHVHDIKPYDDILKNLSLSNKTKFVFFEVPNGELPECGGKNGEIMVPHTYYFESKFFEKLPLKKIFLSKPDTVIRYLGKSM